MIVHKKDFIKSAILLLLLITIIPTSWAATITARFDRNPVHLDESFRLVFESDGNVGGNPNFSPLENNFDILSRNQGSSMQFINGQVSNKTQWTLTLMAKHAGSFLIPAIQFGRDSSPTLRIIVKPTRQGKSTNDSEVLVEVEAEPKNAYVQSQIIYTVRLLRTVNLANASLSEPELTTADAVIERLGDDREYETRRNGVGYVVIERNYAIFPQQSGKLSVKPIVFEGQILQQRSRNLFDPFAQASRVKRLKSESITLNIKPMPATAKAGHWLPAKLVQLVDEWPEPLEFKVGEPVTRTITIQANGVTSAQLPELSNTAPEGIKLYPDQPVLNDVKRTGGIIGTRQLKTALIPTQEGNFILPGIEIPWWNTDKNRQEFAHIAERTINVVAADSGSTITTPTLAESGINQQTLESAEGKITEAMGFIQSQANLWFWVSIVLAFGWLGSIIYWFVFARKAKPESEEKQVRLESLKKLKRDLKQACANENAVEAKAALLGWARLNWQDKSPTNLGDIGKRAGGYFANELNALSLVLYAQDASGGWQGKGLWQAFEQYNTSAKVKNDQESAVLAPLYP